jgi:hypothetical protein
MTKARCNMNGFSFAVAVVAVLAIYAIYNRISFRTSVEIPLCSFKFEAVIPPSIEKSGGESAQELTPAKADDTCR